jgi:hypothetical protein
LCDTELEALAGVLARGEAIEQARLVAERRLLVAGTRVERVCALFLCRRRLQSHVPARGWPADCAAAVNGASGQLMSSGWPVVSGSGQRLFEEVDTSGLELRLTDERRLKNGSVILTYAPG